MKYPRHFKKTLALATALAGIAGLTLIRPDVPNAILPPNFITATEEFNGVTHGVLLDTPYLHSATPSEEENRSPQTAIWYAVWQRLTDKGWQIVLFNAQGSKELQLTDAIGDHIDPQTDGRYVVWQGKDEGAWNVYLYDIENPDKGSVKISSNAPAKHARISEGTVIWQQWVGDNWEIYLWTNGLTSRFTRGSQSSIEPDIFHSMAVWTEVAPGPHNRIRAYNLKTQQDTYLDTESNGQIRPNFLEDGTLQWFAFQDEGYVKREYNFLTDNETHEVIKAANTEEPAPVVEPAPSEPAPVEPTPTPEEPAPSPEPPAPPVEQPSPEPDQGSTSPVSVL